LNGVQIFIFPFLDKIIQSCFCSFFGENGVNVFYIMGKFFSVFPNDVLTVISNLMDHKYLCLKFGENRANDLGKSVQIIGGSNQNIFHTANFQIGQNTHPEAGTFVLSKPHSQNFFFAFTVQTNG